MLLYKKFLPNHKTILNVLLQDLGWLPTCYWSVPFFPHFLLIEITLGDCKVTSDGVLPYHVFSLMYMLIVEVCVIDVDFLGCWVSGNCLQICTKMICCNVSPCHHCSINGIFVHEHCSIYGVFVHGHCNILICYTVFVYDHCIIYSTLVCEVYGIHASSLPSLVMKNLDSAITHWPCEQ